MRPLFSFALFVFLVANPVAVFGKKIGSLFDAFSLVDEVFNLLGRVDQIRAEHHNDNEVNTERLEKLLSRQITTSSEEMDKKFSKVFKQLEKLPQEFLFLVDKRALKENYQNIQGIAVALMLSQIRMNQRKMYVPDRPSGLTDSWNTIRNLIKQRKFFTKLSTNWDDYYSRPWKGVCRTDMSMAQVIYTLVAQYWSISKLYFMARNIELNIKIRNQEVNGGKADFDDEVGDLYSDIQAEVNEDMKYFKKIMSETSRDFWTCDKKTVDQQSPWFVELKAFTKYFTVKKNIPVPCDTGCSNVNITECKSRYDKGLCGKVRSCPNELISCQPDRSEQSINFCANDRTKETYRRFMYITHGSCDKTCKKGFVIPNNEDLFDRHWNGGRVVSAQTIRDERYFECICHEETYVINTHPVKADPGHIIIGAQLTVLNRTLVIAAVQGKLDNSGYVQNSTIKQPPVKRRAWKIDHEVLNWNDEIDLTPATVPESHVVTGFRFKKRGSRFFLILHSQKLGSDYQLVSPAKWNKNHTFGSEEYSFSTAEDRPDNSTKHNKHSKSNQFVKFTVSGLCEDGGQSTIPFIDTQVVQPVSLAPLTGVSLYVRGQDGFGGFLGLKLQTLNVVPYLGRRANMKNNISDIPAYLRSL